MTAPRIARPTTAAATAIPAIAPELRLFDDGAGDEGAEEDELEVEVADDVDEAEEVDDAVETVEVGADGTAEKL